MLAEKTARKAKKGLWHGDFIKPWDWRKGKRLVATSSTNTNKCKIKGNISSSGKIYHTQKSNCYTKTKINTSKGECWFCTEVEARAAKFLEVLFKSPHLLFGAAIWAYGA